MRADWRQLLVLPGFIVVLSVWVAITSGWSRTVAAFLLGATMTLVLVGWMIGFDARSLRWRWGAVGEQWTAEELAKLEPQWSVYHDIPDGNGNWDHVAVGPAGVFAIDSKNVSQPATIDEEGLRSGRLRYRGGSTRGSAVRMKELIQQRTGLSVWVQGVVVVWGGLPGGIEERDHVLYVPGGKLVGTLESRPRRLPDTTCVSVGAVLEASITAAHT